MHQNDLHHKIARLSMIKFNEDARPYLDIDDTGIVLKKDMQLGNHEYMEVPA